MSARRTPTRFFLLDPTFGIVLALLLIVGGLISYASMVRENYPDLAIPQATVATVWAGASPLQMEKEVTKPLEDEIRALPGLKDFASSSRESFSLVTVQFQADVDLAFAMQQLRVRVDAAAAEFPRQVEKSVIEQVSVNDLPMMTLVVAGPVGALAVEQAAERLGRDLEQIDGVRKTGRQGDRGRAVQVRLIPERLRSFGLSPVDVRERLRAANQDLAWGSFDDPAGRLPLYLQGRFQDLDDIRSVVIGRTGDETAIRVGDVAEVRIALRPFRGSTQVSIDGAAFERAITLSVLKRPGADTIAAIARVRGHLDGLAADPDWPADIAVTVLSDEGEIIQASFNEVQSNLVQGVAAVFLVLLVALTWRAAAVAAFALPITLLGALAVINMFGFSQNTLVTLGMVIALGILVDVFILVMEGMHEGMSVRGESFDQAAVATAKTFLLPAVAGQATTILAMVPLMIIGGVDGKFIRLIPFTAIACLAISLVVAFAVCIPLSRYLLKARADGRGEMTTVDRLTLKASGALQRFLVGGPARTRASAGVTVAAGVAAFIGALVVADSLPSIVYPKEDRRSLGVGVELRPDAGFADAERVADTIGAALRGRPEIESVMVHAGEVSPYALPTIEDYLLPSDGGNLVGASVRFRPKAERDRLAFEYLPDIRAALEAAVADEPGAVVRLVPDLGGATAGAPIQIEVRGEDLGELSRLAGDVTAMLQAIPGVSDIRDTLGAFPTEARFVADQEALSFYGLDEGELLEQIRIAMVADKIGTFQMPGSEPDLDITLSTAFASRGGESGGPTRIYELEAFSIQTPEGDRVPLASLVEATFRPTPVAIIHADGARAVTVKAQVSGAATASGVIGALQPSLDAAAAGWPDGYGYRLRGEAEAAADTFGRTRTALALALFLVFAVMALLFGSFRQPLIIMAMVPLSLTGVFYGFAILGIPISFAAMIGVIALIGIVVNDAIVMVEVINKRRAEGMSKPEAAAHGASDRLRPILTTSVTTIVGLTPLAFSSPAWYPLCMAIILGLTVATVFALIVIPALYVLIEGAAERRVPVSEARA